MIRRGKICTISDVKKIIILVLFAVLVSGCSKLFKNPFASDDSDEGRPSAVPDRVTLPTAKFSLAVGGVAPGRDELVLYDADGNVRDFSTRTLECTSEKPIVILKPRPGYASESAGSGVQIIPTEAGITAVTCKGGGTEMGYSYEVTIPPQYLIQILVAEAGQQLNEEAELDENGAVKLTSTSATGNAIASVIKNRIELINIKDEPALFEADAEDYDVDPPISYYDAVIMAPNQFLPTIRSDPGYKTFSNAQDRNFLDEEWLAAYDQAVLTAASIFNGDIADSAGSSFAFRSPSDDEWGAIVWGIGSASEIPAGAGFSDSTFPSLAPIQLLVDPAVWKYESGKPSFIFARSRTLLDPAITNIR